VHFICGPIANNCYLAVRDGESVLVDAPIGSMASYEKFTETSANELRGLLLTHGHWDHMAEAALFQKKYSVPVYANEGDLPMLLNPDAMRSYSVPAVEILPCRPDVAVCDGDKLQLLGSEWIVRSVAGHTPGGVVYGVEDEKLLFSGDSLFRGTVGRSDLPGGNGELLIEQLLERVMSLPDWVNVLPGHGHTTTIGEERRHNGHLKL
jgi:glyoxylase-like metal-dependent hydrolase (beta-lactamase superfamily II)